MENVASVFKSILIMELLEQFSSKIVEWLHIIYNSSQTNDKIESRRNKRPRASRTFPAPETARQEQNCWHVFIFHKDHHSCSDVNWLNMFSIFVETFCLLLYNYQQRIARCIDMKFEFSATFCAVCLLFGMCENDKIKLISHIECPNARTK